MKGVEQGKVYFVVERTDTDYSLTPPAIRRSIAVFDKSLCFQLPGFGIVDSLTEKHFLRMKEAKDEGAHFFPRFLRGIFTQPIDIGADREVYSPLSINSPEFIALNSRGVLS